MHSKLYRLFIILILFFCFFIISAKSYATNISHDLMKNIFRLHIIANSDSDEDQLLKLKIRDEILIYMKEITKSCTTKSEVQEKTQNEIPKLIKIAKETIIKNGYNYDVNIKIGNFYFPTKYYGNISMPAGNYDALKIEIGNANGQNWWCSLFPSLCFTDVSTGVIDKNTDNTLKSTLNEEEYNLLTSSKSSIKIKFKILEIFKK